MQAFSKINPFYFLQGGRNFSISIHNILLKRKILQNKKMSFCREA